MTSEELWAKFYESCERQGGVYLPDDIMAAVQGNEMQWFKTKDEEAHIITQVVPFPQKRVLFFVCAFGDFMKERNGWELHRQIVDFARSEKCDTLHIEGRDGWEPHLKKLGWQKDCVTYKLDLEAQ